MKRAIWLVLVALGTIALALLAWHMRSVVVLLVAAIFLGATMRPIGARLERIGVPRSISVVLMALIIVVGVFFLLGVVGYSVAEEAPQLVRELHGKYVSLRADWNDGEAWQQNIVTSVGDPLSLDAMVAALDSMNSQGAAPEASDPLAILQQETGVDLTGGADAPADGSTATPVAATQTAAGDSAGANTGGESTGGVSAGGYNTGSASAFLRVIVEAAGGVAALLGQLIILVFVSIYWSLEHEWFERLWTSLLPAHLRQPARQTWRSIETNVGDHLRSEIVQSLLAFVLSWALFSVLGVHQSLLLATIVALAWYVPLVGWLIALVVLLPIAILSPLWVTIAAAAGLIAIFALLEFVIERRLDKAREKLEIVGLVFAMIFLEFFGLLGLLLASPVAVALAAGSRTWAVERSEQREVIKESAVQTLNARLIVLRDAIRESDKELPQRTLSLYERLEELLVEAEPSLQRRSSTGLSGLQLARNSENVTRQLGETRE